MAPPAIDVACLPRVVKVNSGCGCTLTRASIKGMTPAEFTALSNKEIALATVMAESIEAGILGVPERPLTTLLKSRITGMKPAIDPKSVHGPQSIILPYAYRQQRSIVNSSYFMIESGAAPADAGATAGIPASAWDVVVNLGIGEWKTDLEAIERYFMQGLTLFVFNWDDTSAKVSQTLQFKVLRAVNSDSGGVSKATITLLPNISDAGWTALSAAAKVLLHPQFGIVQTGANSVSDWESWCFNSPSENPRKFLINWFQTTRTTRCIDDEYKKTLELVMAGKVNPFYANFNNLTPIAEQNKQAAQLEEKQWLRSILYGQAEQTDLQTVENYDQLPKVTDPEDNTCTIEYKANALGIETLLSACSRIIDMEGADLDLDQLFAWLYTLKRNREAEGDTIDTIDCITDRATAANIFKAMNAYLKAVYGIDTTRWIQVKKQLVLSDFVSFEHNIYDLPDQGLQLAVFVAEEMNDHLAQFPASTGTGIPEAFKARGRDLWFLDWSDINPVISKTNAVTRRHPAPEVASLYKCRMMANIREYTLRSKTWSVYIDRPARHLLIRNFSGNCPLFAPTVCAVPNP